MKSLLLIPLVLVSSVVMADTNWSGAVYYNLKDRTSSAVALSKLTTFTHIAGRFSLDLDAFAGVTVDGKSGVAGFALGRNLRIADQVSGFAGLGASISQGRPVSFGFLAGISVRF